ncbi:diuretic hormone receptor [Ixodes scapularis]|uniref:diuretic hormone receptor n=1 Tax=Ixodes scapularis TaxID=6945 RepID=UPI001A9F7B67|nr:diuretic hormone receptor [Ixodes scapularis]
MTDDSEYEFFQSPRQDPPETSSNGSVQDDHELRGTSSGAAASSFDGNGSLSARLLCYMSARTFNETGARESSSSLRCRLTWDGLSCWPSTPASSVAVLPCFASFNDLLYDTSQNATRHCWSNGTWAERSDYSNCRPLLEGVRESETHLDETTLYYIGYGLSLFALSVALWIFLYYKDLRCLRNTIHINLMITYFLISLTWIVTATLQSVPSSGFHRAACFLYIVLTYLMGTNFFWMFVEGLYLYILVVKTFSVEVFRLYICLFIGWGLPAIIICTWATTKVYLSPNHNDPNLSNGMCVWQLRDLYDCIFIVPVILVLLTNMFFLAEIMWVLITKLRAATTVESQQYRKAAKALLVLIPLLGVTYILVIWTPRHKTAKVIFTYLQATLLSTQGFTVAVLYCFLNGEVRKAIRHHLERWKTMRALRRGDNSRQSSTYKFGDARTPSSAKRGSSVSFSTTTTCVGNNRSHSSWKRHSNASSGQPVFKDDLV